MDITKVELKRDRNYISRSGNYFFYVLNRRQPIVLKLMKCSLTKVRCLHLLGLLIAGRGEIAPRHFRSALWIIFWWCLFSTKGPSDLPRRSLLRSGCRRPGETDPPRQITLSLLRQISSSSKLTVRSSERRADIAWECFTCPAEDVGI